MEREREGALWVTTQELGSGWAAVMLVHVTPVDEDGNDCGDGYVDVMDTGMGRYATQAEAQAEGRAWAEDENLPFVG